MSVAGRALKASWGTGLLLWLPLLCGVFGEAAESGKDSGLRIMRRASAEKPNRAGAPAEASSPKTDSKENSVPQKIDWQYLVGILRADADAAHRLDAARKLKTAKFKKVPLEVSTRLVRTIVGDGDPRVRKEAARAVKSLKDSSAVEGLLAAGLSKEMPREVRVRAAEGLRMQDNPGLFERIVRIATLTIRFGVAREVEEPQIIYITNGGDVDNPFGTINLPIELPQLELASVNTSVAVYAGEMLKVIARRDFGRNRMAWKGWFNEWKRVRKARLEAEKEDASLRYDDFPGDM